MSDEDTTHADPPQEPGVDTGTATLPTEAEPITRLLPPYKVLLHDDNVNDMLEVVSAILKLTTLTAEEAAERMFEAHHTGVALLLVTHKERAELYCEQFATFHLKVTAEPDS
jgi:ATP-dependent Clp protease adaptor protein ClpS